MRLKDVRTKYVRNKIKGRSFKDEDFRDYIDTLMMIEGFVLKGPSHLAEAYAFHAYKREFKEEYGAIKDELTPGWREKEAKALAKEKKKETVEEKKRKSIEKREEEQTKKEWLRFGGKP